MLPILSFAPHSDFTESQCAYINSDANSEVRFMVDFARMTIVVIADKGRGSHLLFSHNI